MVLRDRVSGRARSGAGADGAGKIDQVSLRVRGKGAAEQAGWLCPGAGTGATPQLSDWSPVASSVIGDQPDQLSHGAIGAGAVSVACTGLRQALPPAPPQLPSKAGAACASDIVDAARAVAVATAATAAAGPSPRCCRTRRKKWFGS